MAYASWDPNAINWTSGYAGSNFTLNTDNIPTSFPFPPVRYQPEDQVDRTPEAEESPEVRWLRGRVAEITDLAWGGKW